MGVVRVDVAPELLRWAVRRAGWDEETALRRVPKLADWLAGASRPTLKQLEKFASDTHAPFGMLFLPEPPVETIPIPDMRTIRDAGVAGPSADLLDTIYLCQRRQDWYRDYALDAGAEQIDFVGSVTITAPPEAVAGRMRDLLRIGDHRAATWSEAMTDLIERTENLGVLVMVNGVVGGNTHRRLNPEEFRGFALSDDVAPLIFVNGADTRAAQIFTLIQEFAHLWLGRSALSDVALDARGGKVEERWCNRVAAETLVPLDSLGEQYRGSADEDELDRLARMYKVSTLVVLGRLLDAGCLTRKEYATRYDVERERVIGLARTTRDGGAGGNYYNTQLRRLGRPFARAVITSTLEGRTTYRDAYRLLGARRHSTFEGLTEKVRAA